MTPLIFVFVSETRRKRSDTVLEKGEEIEIVEVLTDEKSAGYFKFYAFIRKDQTNKSRYELPKTQSCPRARHLSQKEEP